MDSRLTSESGLTVGDQLGVVVQGEPRSVTVSGIAEAPGLPTRAAPAVFFDQRTALELNDGSEAANGQEPDAIDALAVVASSGTDPSVVADRIELELVGADVDALVGSDRGRMSTRRSPAPGDNLVVLGAVIGGNGTAIAIFGIASALGLTVAERQRELALLKTLGTTPKQLDASSSVRRSCSRCWR